MYVILSSSDLRLGKTNRSRSHRLPWKPKMPKEVSLVSKRRRGTYTCGWGCQGRSQQRGVAEQGGGLGKILAAWGAPGSMKEIQLKKLPALNFPRSHWHSQYKRWKRVDSKPVPAFKSMDGHVSTLVQWSHSLLMLRRKRKSKEIWREKRASGTRSTQWRQMVRSSRFTWQGNKQSFKNKIHHFKCEFQLSSF